MTRVQKIVVHVILIAGFFAITYQYGHLTDDPPRAGQRLVAEGGRLIAAVRAGREEVRWRCALIAVREAQQHPGWLPTLLAPPSGQLRGH